MSDATTDFGALSPAIQRDQPLVRHGERNETSFDPSAFERGKVIGAFGRRDARAGTEKFDYLPPGQSRTLPPGTAIKVQTHGQAGTAWHSFYFLEQGLIEGPLIWKDSGEAPRRELESIGKDYRAHKATIGGMAVASLAAAAHMIAFPGDWTHIRESTSLLEAIAISLPVTAAIGVLTGMLAGLFSRLAPTRKSLTPKRLNFAPRLRVDRSLLNLLPALHATDGGNDATSEIAKEPVSLGAELDTAIASYHACRQELDELGVSVQALDHTARIVDGMHERISKHPRLLRDDTLRTSFLQLVARAEADVAAQIDKHDANASAGLLSEIRALEQQLDRMKHS